MLMVKNINLQKKHKLAAIIFIDKSKIPNNKYLFNNLKLIAVEFRTGLMIKFLNAG